MDHLHSPSCRESALEMRVETISESADFLSFCGHTMKRDEEKHGAGHLKGSRLSSLFKHFLGGN